MAEDPKFVTVLKSSDAGFIDLVATMLDAEGIPCQHPGKNHAAMNPGFMFLEVELRVPESRLADARALVDRLRAPDESSTRIAFRVRRTYRALGGILGMVLGIWWMNRDFSTASELIRTAVLGLSIGAGYLAGWAIRRESCSLPGCRAKLPAAVAQCPKCGAEIRGVISSPNKHFAEAEKITAQH